MDSWKLKQKYLSSGGTIAYDVFGDGPPVVLVHGTPSSSYLWRKIVPELAKSWTVFVYDLLGYGQSEKREGQNVSIAAQTRYLAEMLNYWKLDTTDVVAHDFGAPITLRAHLLEGREFRRIALMDPWLLVPWASYDPLDRHVKKHVEHLNVFQEMPDHIHRQIVTTYIRGEFGCKMDDTSLAPYLEPWMGREGSTRK